MMFTPMLAATTTDDIFKSMGDTAGSEINIGQVIAVIAAIVGLIIVISLFKRKADAPKKSSVPNNPARLLRDMAKATGLTRRDVRELKRLAELVGVDSPLTLLLCPSLMQDAIAKRNADR